MKAELNADYIMAQNPKIFKNKSLEKKKNIGKFEKKIDEK